MTFYNNNMIIADTIKNGMYIFTSTKENIIMNHYNHGEDNMREVIAEDLLGEFDAMVQKNGEVYLLYQNLEYKLKIIKINGKDIEPYNLTNEKLSKVIQINIFELNSYKNIFYVIRGSHENTYSIKHYILKEDKWWPFNVEEIIVDKILNPIKIIKDNTGFLLTYYNENTILIKRFNMEDNSWGKSIGLTDNKQKLYTDMMLEEGSLHLVYCEFDQENLEIKYIRYNFKEEKIEKSIEHNISQGINPTNPTLLVYDKKIWIVWNESLNLYSRCSENEGNTWSPIYLWKDVKKKDFVRYKYIKDVNNEDMNLDYSFGSMGEEIELIGFGPLNNVEEINKKKLENQKMYPTMMENWRR